MTSSRDLLDSFQIECIGTINTEWALLEATVSVAIWDYCGLDRDRGLIVTSDLGALAKINMLTALARVRFGDPSPALTKLLDITGEMRALNTERNIIAHNLWSMDYVVQRMRTKRKTAKEGKLKEAPIVRTSDELLKTYSRITAAIANLEKFQKESGVQPPSRTR
jgi:hypothetical protein